MTVSTTAALRRTAAVGGLTVALGAGALGTAAHAASPTAVSRSFNVCVPTVTNCAAVRQPAVSAQGKFTFTRDSVHGKVKAVERTNKRATFKVAYHLKNGAVRTVVLPIDKKLDRSFGYPATSRAMHKIVVRVCAGTACGKPQTIKVPAV
ncbi:hypothetical protein [Actinomadura hibisca]|uniref:hypothetical protein n=1 Tax=Actinomadura hibisca TaxID=68565 RepID=UPI00082EFC4F|nr:hypothetical protein [Actinomadura hibisca]